MKFILGFISKFIFALFIMLYILYCNLIALDNNRLYAIYSAISIIFIFLIIVFLIKKSRWIYFAIILILFLIFNSIPLINPVFDKDTCLDTGYCKEGILLNTANGQIKVNKDTCNQNNGEWHSKEESCQFK